eukprot:g2774.t1
MSFQYGSAQLPQARAGPRPETGTCLPHCQMTEESTEELFREFAERATSLMRQTEVASQQRDALFCVEVERSGISVATTFPAFHLVCRQRIPEEEAGSAPDGATGSRRGSGDAGAGAAANRPPPFVPVRPPRQQVFMIGTEFAHIHAKYLERDPAGRNRPWQVWQGGGLGSMHVVLHPEDAAALTALGWTEYHLLANQRGVPPGLVLVYAPRTADEIQVCLAILKASLDYCLASVA